MFGFKSKAAKRAEQLVEVETKLVAAYDQLAAGNRVRNVEEFHAYGRKYGVDTVTLVDNARADIERRSAEQTARRAERQAAIARGRKLLAVA